MSPPPPEAQSPPPEAARRDVDDGCAAYSGELCACAEGKRAERVFVIRARAQMRVMAQRASARAQELVL